MIPDTRRPSPEELLERVEAEERHQARGSLKIFLGYAGGVGKSVRMFDEGRRRKKRGEDIVVAATQSGPSGGVPELVRDLEVIPPRPGSGQAIDVATVLRRHPQVCLIDGLAYRNPPGSKNPQRWQDVEELLAAGVSVVSSINLQYIQERQAQVEAIRGKAVHDSVPEAFIRTADEIELVDAPPEYCVNREQANEEVSASDAARLQHQLSGLREIALVLAADVVDHQLEEYLHRHGIAQMYGTHERILVCVTPRSNASLMIRRGRRQTDRFHGELYVVYVEQEDLKAQDQEILYQNLECAKEARAQVEILRGEDPIHSILEFASRHGITQIFAGHSERSGFMSRWKANPVERLILESDGIDVRIFPHGESPA